MDLSWGLGVLLLAGAYVGWNIGANDAGNCVGTAVGSGILSLRRAILLTAIFALAGALLQGHYVMKTMGKGIVQEGSLDLTAVLVALIFSGLFVTIATYFKIPVSTSQAIVGGVIGVGYAAEASVKLDKVVTILECWVVCPFLTMALSFVLYHLIDKATARFSRSFAVGRILSLMVILSSCYVSFSMGANNVGNAMGPVSSLSGISPLLLALLGGVALAIGTWTFGSRVTETLGKGITPLDLTGALAAQLSSAFRHP